MDLETTRQSKAGSQSSEPAKLPAIFCSPSVQLLIPAVELREWTVPNPKFDQHICNGQLFAKVGVALIQVGDMGEIIGFLFAWYAEH